MSEPKAKAWPCSQVGLFDAVIEPVFLQHKATIAAYIGAAIVFSFVELDCGGGWERYQTDGDGNES